MNTEKSILDAEILEINEDSSVLSLTLKEDHLNPFSSVHGGVLFTLADEAAGLLINSLYEEIAVTVDSSFHFLKPVIHEERIKAKAVLLSKGRKISVAEVSITNDSDVLFAKGTFTYASISKKPAL